MAKMPSIGAKRRGDSWLIGLFKATKLKRNKNENTSGI